MLGRLITEGKSDVADKSSVYLGKFAFGSFFSFLRPYHRRDKDCKRRAQVFVIVWDQTEIYRRCSFPVLLTNSKRIKIKFHCQPFDLSRCSYITRDFAFRYRLPRSSLDDQSSLITSKRLIFHAFRFTSLPFVSLIFSQIRSRKGDKYRVMAMIRSQGATRVPDLRFSSTVRSR